MVTDITLYHLSLNVDTTDLIPVYSILLSFVPFYHPLHSRVVTHARFPESYMVMFGYGILKTQIYCPNTSVGTPVKAIF